MITMAAKSYNFCFNNISQTVSLIDLKLDGGISGTYNQIQNCLFIMVNLKLRDISSENSQTEKIFITLLEK